MKKFSTLTKEEKERRILYRRQALREARILEAMEANGYAYDYAFHYGLETFAFLLKKPLGEWKTPSLWEYDNVNSEAEEEATPLARMEDLGLIETEYENVRLFGRR